MVEVALFAASAANSPPVETMISTGRCASSSAISGSRSCWPSAQRYSIVRFCPLDKAAFAKALAERYHQVRCIIGRDPMSALGQKQTCAARSRGHWLFARNSKQCRSLDISARGRLARRASASVLV